MTQVAQIADGDLDSRTKMILAGELLFAREGIDGVSLRRIAAAAGQKNHHAVQYHFGTRDGLVQAIFDFRMDQMEEHRAQMLAQAKAGGKLGDARTLVEIIFMPQLALIDSFGDHSYANFLCQFLLRNEDAGFGRFGGNLPTAINQTLELLRQRLDFLEEGAAQRRLITACFMFLNMLAVYTRDLESGRASEDFGSALDDTMGQIVAALFMPLAGK